jgi:polysaccharide export outer membrane protein
MEELTGERRVSEQGTIVLSLLGAVPVGGLTERQTADKLRGALAEFVKDPQVTVAIAEIHGSQVSVMGAVSKPGVYPVRGLDKTIADLITQAGGMTKEAGTAVYFSPSTGSKDLESRRETAAALRLDSSAPGLFAQSGTAITIDLTPLYQGRNVPDLLLPVRPGDMIVVSASGEIFVEGWVNNPGAFKLARAMTLTQAIAAAGGMHFGGADGKVKLVRKSPTGENKTFGVEYAAISDGTAPDVYLESGDHIEIGANPAKSIPWGLFSFLKSIFSFGVSGNAPTVGAK